VKELVLVIGTLDTKGPEVAYVRDKLKEFGLNARNLVVQRFSIEGMIKEYLEVINKLIK